MTPCKMCDEKDKCLVLCKRYLKWVFDDTVETVLTAEEKEPVKKGFYLGKELQK